MEERIPLRQDNDAEGGPELSGPLLVQQTARRVLSERVRLLGIDRSGAYAHYEFHLARGLPIPEYELAILDFVHDHLAGLRTYHEIGSGFGILPAMLAHDGFPAVGVERDERRHLTATAILRELGKRSPQVEANCRLIGAEFPDAVADIDVSESVAILTDFVGGHTSEDFARTCEGLARYRYVLMDLQRFCEVRDTPEEQEALVAELARFGLVASDQSIDLGGQGFYQLFESQAAERRRSRTSEVTTTEAPTALKPAPDEELPATIPDAETAIDISPVYLPPSPRRAKRRRFGGMIGLSALLVIGVPTILAIIYYGFVQSNQYVTNFEFVVRGAAQLEGRGGLFGGGPSSIPMSPDAYVITDYINSPQAAEDVAHDVDLRAIFAPSGADSWSKLNPSASAEAFEDYWKRMVVAHFDLVSGNVTVLVRAFTPQDSFRLAEALIAKADATFRRMNNQAQKDFVVHSDENLARAEERVSSVQQALLAFRSKAGMLDPAKTAGANTVLIDSLRKEIVSLNAQYMSMKVSSPQSPALGQLKARIDALETQVKAADPASVATIKPVSPEDLGQYERLDEQRKFADKLYQEALELRERAYLTAANQQSYLALFVQPRLPQVSLYPDRIRSILTVVLAAAAAWFVGMILTYAIRDHLM